MASFSALSCTRTPGRLYVGRWNERVRTKRCDAVDWGVLKWGDSTDLHSNLDFFRNQSSKLPSMWISNFFSALFCSEAIAKGEFFWDENRTSHCEWVRSLALAVRVSFWLMNKVYTRKLSSLVSVELVYEFLRTMLNHNQFLLSIVSYSFYQFGEFAEVLILTGESDAFKKLICILERVHFHVRVGVKSLTKYFFAIFCAEICCNSFRQCYKATNIMCVSSTLWNFTLGK